MLNPFVGKAQVLRRQGTFARRRARVQVFHWSGCSRVQFFTGFVPLPTKDLCLADEGLVPCRRRSQTFNYMFSPFVGKAQVLRPARHKSFVGKRTKPVKT